MNNTQENQPKMTDCKEETYTCNECGTHGWGDERGEIDDDGDFTCEECVEKAYEEEDEDCTRKECYECGETKSCGLYNENHEWRCEDCCPTEE